VLSGTQSCLDVLRPGSSSICLPCRKPTEPAAQGQISSLRGALRKRCRQPSSEEESESSEESEPDEALATHGEPATAHQPPALPGKGDERSTAHSQPTPARTLTPLQTAAAALPRPPAKPAVFIPVNRTPDIQVCHSRGSREGSPLCVEEVTGPLYLSVPSWERPCLGLTNPEGAGKAETTAEFRG
jgi:hypothetical protein